MTTKTDTKMESKVTPEMDTWDMACAVLTALRQTHQQAQDEYAQIMETSDGKPFTPGLTGARLMIETLKPALRKLEDDMHMHARSCGLEMPKVEN